MERACYFVWKNGKAQYIYMLYIYICCVWSARAHDAALKEVRVADSVNLLPARIASSVLRRKGCLLKTVWHFFSITERSSSGWIPVAKRNLDDWVEIRTGIV